MEKDLLSFLAASKKIVKEYIETRLALLRVQALEKIIRALGMIFTIMIALLLILLFIIFLGITAGFWIAYLTGSFALGFLIISGVFLIILIILLIFRRPLVVRPVANLILNIISEMEDDDTEKKDTDAGQETP